MAARELRAKAFRRRKPLDCGWLRVARGGCGAKASPLATRLSAPAEISHSCLRPPARFLSSTFHGISQVMSRGGSAADYVRNGQEVGEIEVDLNDSQKKNGVISFKRRITRSTVSLPLNSNPMHKNCHIFFIISLASDERAFLCVYIRVRLPVPGPVPILDRWEVSQGERSERQSKISRRAAGQPVPLPPPGKGGRVWSIGWKVRHPACFKRFTLTVTHSK